MIYTHFKNGQICPKPNNEIKILKNKNMLEILENFFDEISINTFKILKDKKIICKRNPLMPLIEIHINENDKSIYFVYMGKKQNLPVIYYYDNILDGFKIDEVFYNLEEVIFKILETNHNLYMNNSGYEDEDTKYKRAITSLIAYMNK